MKLVPRILTALALASLLGATALAQTFVSEAPKQEQDASFTSPARNTQRLTALPRNDIYAVNSDNTLFVLRAGSWQFRPVTRFDPRLLRGHIIGIDFRPANDLLYLLTNTGNLYEVDLFPRRFANLLLVRNVTPRFAGGFQSLMDFNPVVNALRLIGSNDQNFALVNSAGNLDLTVPQTAISYALGDFGFGADPNLSGGAYSNNVNGARVTLFYAVDYDLHTFVTILPAAPGGSSATAGGQLSTLGALVDGAGRTLTISPTADFDIYTSGAFNQALGFSGRMLWALDLATIANLSPVAQGTDPASLPSIKVWTMSLERGDFIDLAVDTMPAPRRRRWEQGN